MLEFSKEGNFKIAESLQKSIVALEREKHIMQHVMKCFTFGKEIRRDAAGNFSFKQVDKISEIKESFCRVGLIRKYFNKSCEASIRKFRGPIT